MNQVTEKPGPRYTQQTAGSPLHESLSSDESEESDDEVDENLGTDERKRILKEKLANEGITLSRITPGTIRTICPECEGGSMREKSFALTVRQDFMVCLILASYIDSIRTNNGKLFWIALPSFELFCSLQTAPCLCLQVYSG